MTPPCNTHTLCSDESKYLSITEMNLFHSSFHSSMPLYTLFQNTPLCINPLGECLIYSDETQASVLIWSTCWQFSLCPVRVLPSLFSASNAACNQQSTIGNILEQFFAGLFFFLTELGGPGGQGSRHHYKPKTSTDLAQVLSKQLKLNKCLWLK